MSPALALLALAAQSPDLPDVLGPGADRLLFEHLLDEARSLAAARERARRASLASPADLRRRQTALLAEYRSLLGPLPERSPLDPVVAGAIQADGYRIERVHYQSRPGHRVTANLYLPDGEGPFPGAVVPCGHSAEGKAYPSYQLACALLARTGIAALIYDPIGQGERHQLELDRHGTTEHELVNAAALLVGWSAAALELWDGVRSIDYLLSRPELGGATEVAVTGNSGGGTQTVYLSAFEERVSVAAPSCYVMTHLRIFETIGPQDGCQWLPREGLLGLDHSDYLALRAPRPTRILAAKRDFFEYTATERAYEEAREAWAALGAADRVDLFAFDDAHGWSRPRREAAAEWLARWLLGRDGPVEEPELEVFAEEELRVTGGGQVLGELEGERSVVDLLLERAEALRPARRALWADPGEGPLDEVRRLLALRDDSGPAEVREVGATEIAGATARRFVVERPVPLAAVWIVPEAGVEGRPVLYLSDDGWRAGAASGGDVSKLVATGRPVLAVDLAGYGETADRGSDAKYRNVEHRVAMLALHVGRPLLGHRLADARAGLDLVSDLVDEVGTMGVDVLGVGRAGVVAWHLAALDERVAGVEVRGSISSWIDDVLATPESHDRLGNVVPSALATYDLPDLVARIGPRRVELPR